MTTKTVLFFGLLIIWFTHVPSALALVCGEDIPPRTPEGVLNNYRDSCLIKLTELTGQEQTVTQALAILNTQISLTQVKIASTTNQLDKLKAEIGDLSSRIDSIDYSLTDLTKIFISRVRETYMYRGTPDALLVSQVSGLPNIVRAIEYAKIIRDHDRTVLISLEKSRLDYNTQKATKEDKQKEIEALKTKLDRDKLALAGQVAAKNKLLADIKTDKTRTQQRLADAQAQLAAFSKFVSNQGGASILSGTTKTDAGWGTYYNQRDNNWGNLLLPGSNYSMATSGCLVTSMAMVLSHYGKSVSPGNITIQPELFSFGDFRQGTLSIGGVTTSRTVVGYSRSVLDSELTQGKPVVVGLYSSSKPQHFIVVKAKEGDDYVINDPFPENGMNIHFTSRYPLSAIARVDRVTVQ